MRCKKTIFLAFTLCIIGLCACDMNTAGQNQSQPKSASASAGGVTSDEDVYIGGMSMGNISQEREAEQRDKTSFSSNALVNSTNQYHVIDDGSWHIGVIQYDLQGKNRKRLVFDELESQIKLRDPDASAVLLVNDQSLVFCVQGYSGKDNSDEAEGLMFYEVALKETNEGKSQPDMDSLTHLFTLSGDDYGDLSAKEDNIFVDLHYIIGLTEWGSYYRFDRKTGELTEEYMPFKKEASGYEEGFEYECECDLYRQSAGNREIYCYIEEQGLEGQKMEFRPNTMYAQNLDTLKWEKIVSSEDGMILEGITFQGNKAGLFLGPADDGYYEEYGSQLFNGDEISAAYSCYVRDFSDHSLDFVFGYRDCKKALIRDGIVTEKEIQDCYPIDFLGYFDNRFYMQANVDWYTDKTYYAYKMIFSVDGDGKEFRYEKELTETMWRAGTEKFIDNPAVKKYRLKDMKRYQTNISRGLVIQKGELFYACEEYSSDSAYEYAIRTCRIQDGEGRKLSGDEKEIYFIQYRLDEDNKNYFLGPLEYIEDEGTIQIQKKQK